VQSTVVNKQKRHKTCVQCGKKIEELSIYVESCILSKILHFISLFLKILHVCRCCASNIVRLFPRSNKPARKPPVPNTSSDFRCFPAGSRRILWPESSTWVSLQRDSCHEFDRYQRYSKFILIENFTSYKVLFEDHSRML